MKFVRICQVILDLEKVFAFEIVKLDSGKDKESSGYAIYVLFSDETQLWISQFEGVEEAEKSLAKIMDLIITVSNL